MTPLPCYPARPGGLRIVVTGGRDFLREDVVFAALDALHATRGIARLAHGAATGADTLAGRWARSRGVEVETYPVTDAEWRTIGKRAGNDRNGRMLATERPDLVVAFPGGRGTADCVKRARKAGIPVREVGALTVSGATQEHLFTLNGFTPMCSGVSQNPGAYGWVPNEPHAPVAMVETAKGLECPVLHCRARRVL